MNRVRTDPAELMLRHASNGVLIDANLLLLLVVGAHDRRLVSTFKRLSVFAPEDFDTLVAVAQHFRSVLVTPHVLTEVSNLAGSLPGNVKEKCFRSFAVAIETFIEVMIPSRDASREASFLRFGLTDASIVRAASRSVLVLTMDFALAQYLESIQLAVINFNHIRYLNWR